jgi:hypothetical protein
MAMCAALSGCESLYVYNAKTDAATAQIKTDFAALKAPAYLDQQHTLATTFNAQEDAAVAALSTSARDAALIDVIRPSPLVPKGTDSAQVLRTQVDARLGALYRANTKAKPWTAGELDTLARLYALSTDADQVDVTASEVASVTSTHAPGFTPSAMRFARSRTW